METRLQKRKKIEMKKKIKKLKDEPLPGTSKQAEDDLHSPAVKNSDDAVFDIQNLPPELIMKILKYLTLDDLCRAGRVSKAWHELTRSPVFWKRFQANIGGSSILEATFHLINILPPFVTSIDLHFYNMTRFLFKGFAKKLRERCPNLQRLILNRVSFVVETNELLQLCAELPINVRVLALTRCYFFFGKFCKVSEDAASHIEVLDLSGCTWSVGNHFSLTHMSNLKKLRLAGCQYFHGLLLNHIGFSLDQLEILDLERTSTCSVIFHTVINHSQHLSELYVCWTDVKDADLELISWHKGFPCLKIICLRGCDVTFFGLVVLSLSCPTLQKIIIGRRESVLYALHLFVSNIVEDLGYGYCNHSEKVNYMLE